MASSRLRIGMPFSAVRNSRPASVPERRRPSCSRQPRTPQEAWRPLYWRDTALSIGGSLALALLVMWLVELFNRPEPQPAVVLIQPQPGALRYDARAAGTRQSQRRPRCRWRPPNRCCCRSNRGFRESCASTKSPRSSVRPTTRAGWSCCCFSAVSTRMRLLELRWSDVDRPGARCGLAVHRAATSFSAERCGAFSMPHPRVPGSDLLVRSPGRPGDARQHRRADPGRGSRRRHRGRGAGHLGVSSAYVLGVSRAPGHALCRFDAARRATAGGEHERVQRALPRDASRHSQNPVALSGRA